ncbi:MAG TPA: glycosyltransferase family 39 protein [Anaerolineae bacterium]|nr:glycosyltransferase family 39 protein [Anaerolineae bacterium]
MTSRQRLFLLLILLLALALRVFHLDTQSIWYDEGLSIYLAQQPPAQAIALSATTDHPPLYTLLLGAWLSVAGAGDFAARYLSVFFGVLLVALTFALGRKVDERAGLIAAGLMALSPLAVYYSQETRGYTLLTTLVLIATVAFVRLMRGDRRRRIWLVYIAAMSAALYTHYFAAFAWAAINVAYFIDLTGFRKPVRFVANWIIAQFIILAIFAPWLPNALAQAGSNATYFPGRVTWKTVVGDTWRAFTVGEWGDASVVGWVWLALIVLGVGAELFHRSRVQDSSEPRVLRASAVMLLVALVIVPLVLMSGLAWLKPKFAPRYLLPALPAVISLASVGIVTLIDGLRARYCQPASIGLAISLALPLASAAALLPLYTDQSLARPDVRSVVRYIEAHVEPGDAIVLIGGHQAPAFNHYYRGEATVMPLPPDLLPAAQSPLDARAMTTLADIAARHPRVWLVLWQNEISDPTNVVLDALLDKARRIEVGENFHAMSVLAFDVSAASFEILPQNPADFAFTEPLRLVGYNVNSQRITIDTPLRFGLYLRSEGRVTGNYQLFTHVLAADGTLIAQADHIAGADSYPTSLWQPGSLIYNRFEIQLPVETPPGQYHVAVGLYETDRRLKLAGGSDQIELFTITVEP